MSELQRRSPGGAPEPLEAKKPVEDPTEWRPRDNSGYERVQANVSATSMRSEPLNYGSLADKHPHDIMGIEAMARGDLIRAMEQAGLQPDERGIRVRWMCMVEGHGFRRPEGFVHPEAPEDVQRDGIRAWKRCVEMASDSFSKFIYAMVWRPKPDPTVQLPPMRVLALGPVADFTDDVTQEEADDAVGEFD